MSTIRLYYGREKEDMIGRLKDAETSDTLVSTIEVRETVLDEDVAEAMVHLLETRCIETVQFDDCGSYDLKHQAVRLAQALGTVPNVRLAEATNILCQPFCFLESLLTSATKLVHLRIQDHLDSRQIESLSNGLMTNVTVQVLDLSRSRLDDAGFSSLSPGFRANKTLQVLKLRSLGLKDGDLEEPLEALKHHPSLKVLDVSFNNCQDLTHVAHFLQDNQRLKELNVGYQNLWQAPKIDISELTNVLRDNHTALKILALPRNKLSDDDAEMIAQAISSNTTLHTLDVKENHISDEGITSLANAIMDSNNSSIRHMTVLKNPYGMDGAMALRNAVQENWNLFHVGVAENESLCREIRYFCALNRGGRRLFQENPPLSLWPCALERINHMDDLDEGFCSLASHASTSSSYKADIMFCLLRGPAIFESAWLQSPR